MTYHEETAIMQNRSTKYQPRFELREQVVCVQKVICSWVSAERLTPVMIHTKQTTLINDGQRVWWINWHDIHNPDLLVLQSCSKTAMQQCKMSVKKTKDKVLKCVCWAFFNKNYWVLRSNTRKLNAFTFPQLNWKKECLMAYGQVACYLFC